MKAIIVEDELNVRLGFEKLIKKFCPEVDILDHASCVEDATILIEQSSFDILFLDINLPDGSGFDLLHGLSKINFHIIFVTAYDQYAIDAFRVSASDYLLKPISPDALIQSINKIKQQNSAVTNQGQVDILNTRIKGEYLQSEKMVLRDSESILFVQIKDILYCKAEGTYTTFHLEEDRKVLITTNLKEYDRILSPYGFMRAHHSYLINLQRIKSIQRSEGGYIIMDNAEVVPLSVRKKPQIMEAVKRRFLN